jgi:hypothetical protein
MDGHMLAMMMMGSIASHPSWTRIGWRIAYLPNLRVVVST